MSIEHFQVALGRKKEFIWNGSSCYRSAPSVLEGDRLKEQKEKHNKEMLTSNFSPLLVA